MECNREEALRAREIAAKMLAKKDFLGARRIALKSQRLFPGFENIHQLLIVCEVHCAAMAKSNEDLDWYSILQVEATADETVIRKQYDKLAFWLHPDKNTHSGADVALKLVSEARKILCDRKERSLYDIRRQYASKHVASKATQRPNKTGGNRSHADGCKQPPAFVLVFWTICPHCRRRFVYYKRNFLVICNNCDKLFYAFKLHEQAMPSSFLSNSANNAEVSPGKISCQQHGVTNQQTQYTKDCPTGGNTNSERTMDAARIDEHRERDDGADEEDNRSETRSDVVQFSAMNEAKSSAPAADKESVSNLTSVHPDPNFISTQNLRSEDASVVPDIASSCNLQRLGKRKQDDGPDCSHGTDSSNYKRQRNHDSPSSAHEQISNGNAAVAESKSSEHHAFRVDSQDGGIASHEANQQSDKEASGSAAQKLGSLSTYHYPDFFDFGKIRDVNQRLGKRKQDDGPDCSHSTDSSNYKRQSNHDSPSSAYEQISYGDAAVAENKSSEHHALSRVDIQDGRIVSQEANQQSDKEASGSAPQKLGSPVITYHYPDFFDFGKIRDVNQRLGKRKQDVGPDCSHSTDSSNYKRQSNHESPSSAYEQISNGNAAVAENKSSEHHALIRVDSQDGGIASHEASQHSDKEASGSAPQKLGSPVITYHYPDFFDFGKIRDVNLRLGKRKQDVGPDCSHSTDSSNYKRQNNHESPSSAYEQISNGNAAVAENKSSEHHALSRVDIQDGGIARHEANQQNDKEASGSATQKLGSPVIGSPVITYHCPDFFDFGKIRDVNQIAVDQIWALYDNLDGMPRIYAQVKHIDTSDFRVQLTWLEYNARNELEANWNNKELPVSCGNFCLGGETNLLQDPSTCLSHRVPLTTGKNGNSYEIYPNKGEVWALYKRWSSNADNCRSYGCNVVEVVSDGSTSHNVIVSPLISIEGFVSLFTQDKNKRILSIPSSELLRFSHCIPFYRTNGNERVGVAAGLLELDTAALPSDLETAFPSVTLESCMPSEFTYYSYPESEFHNFEEDRSCEKFKSGQIWALYNDADTFPNVYAWVSKVEIQPFEVHLTWLEACPQQAQEKLWLGQDVPVSCGKFKIRSCKTKCGGNHPFSHLVENSQIDTNWQVEILPKVGEVWAVYKNWSPDWIPSSNNHATDYAIGEIVECSKRSTLFSFLTKVDGYVAVFKPDPIKGVLKIPRKEDLRFSHRIPSFRLTKEKGGKLRDFYELDPASVPDDFLEKGVPLNRHC